MKLFDRRNTANAGTVGPVNVNRNSRKGKKTTISIPLHPSKKKSSTNKAAMNSVTSAYNKSVPVLKEHNDGNPSENIENVAPNVNRRAESPFESIAIKTPLRGNTSVKYTSNLQTARTITSNICYNNAISTHVINGNRGVGKTYLAYQCLQLPVTKTTFTDELVWVGLGHHRSLRFQDLIDVYKHIYSQLNVQQDMKMIEFHKILYVPPSKSFLTEEDKQEERRAMIQARDLFAKAIRGKQSLLCLDGLHDADDVKYFQFQSNPQDRMMCKSLITTVEEPFGLSNCVKSWNISALNNNDAERLYSEGLNIDTLNYKECRDSIQNCYDRCRGNALALCTLSRLINDKVEQGDEASLKKLFVKFENAPADPQKQIFILLENIFKDSSLGDSLTKLAWRCFAAFCGVFSRKDCFRPFIPKSPVKALFIAVIKRIEQGRNSDTNTMLFSVADKAEKIIEFLIKMNILNFIDGFDNKNSPRQFYQVRSDIFQEFGQQLSANKETNIKLHELLINEYTSMFNEINASFGSNEIDYYMLKFLPTHTMHANDLEDVSLTLQDERFVEERVKYMGYLKGCQKHIDDTEEMAEHVRLTTNESSTFILASSYQTFARILVKAGLNADENTSAMERDRTIIHCMWKLAFSLFKHFLIEDACKILKRAMELEEKTNCGVKSRILNFDKKFIANMSRIPTSNKNQCSRALILIGSAMAQSDIKQRDAIHLLNIGLQSLEESLGGDSLEVARANVYIGEILYRDFKMYSHALQFFRNALPTFMRQLGEESEELYDAIILIGKSCIHTGDMDTALDILRNIAPKLTGSIALDVKLKVGYIYMIKGQHERAIAILQKAKSATTDQSILQKIEEMIDKSEKDRGRCMI